MTIHLINLTLRLIFYSYIVILLVQTTSSCGIVSSDLKKSNETSLNANFYVDSFYVNLPTIDIGSSSLLFLLDTLIYEIERTGIAKEDFEFPGFIAIVLSQDGFVSMVYQKAYHLYFVFPGNEEETWNISLQYFVGGDVLGVSTYQGQKLLICTVNRVDESITSELFHEFSLVLLGQDVNIPVYGLRSKNNNIWVNYLFTSLTLDAKKEGNIFVFEQFITYPE